MTDPLDISHAMRGRQLAILRRLDLLIRGWDPGDKLGRATALRLRYRMLSALTLPEIAPTEDQPEGWAPMPADRLAQLLAERRAVEDALLAEAGAQPWGIVVPAEAHG